MKGPAMTRFLCTTFLLAALIRPAAAEIWTPLGNPVGTVEGISTLSASQTWFCTTSGYIYTYDGETFAEQTNLSQEITVSLQDIHALDAEHIWTVGYGVSTSAAVVYFYDGTAWSQSLMLTNATNATRFFGVYAADPQHVWACGNNAQVWGTADGGATWSNVYDHADNKIWSAIDGIDAENVWVSGMEYSGQRAQILRFDGSYWLIPYSEPLGGSLRSIDAVTTNDVWALSVNGNVLRYQFGTWSEHSLVGFTNASSCAISRTDYGDTWASAFGGGLYCLDNGIWQADTNLPVFSRTCDASSWYVFDSDQLKGLYVRQIYPALDRIESGIGISWNSVPGRTYRIEWAEDPLNPDWQTADTFTAGSWVSYWGDIGDGTTNRPAPSADSQRIYRVIQP